MLGSSCVEWSVSRKRWWCGVVRRGAAEAGLSVATWVLCSAGGTVAEPVGVCCRAICDWEGGPLGAAGQGPCCFWTA